jgi:hypothetical protein
VGAEVIQRSGKRQRWEFPPAIVTLFNRAAFGKEIYPCTTSWSFMELHAQSVDAQFHPVAWFEMDRLGFYSHAEAWGSLRERQRTAIP